MTGIYLDHDEIEWRLAAARVKHAKYMAIVAHLAGFSHLQTYSQALVEATAALIAIEDRLPLFDMRTAPDGSQDARSACSACAGLEWHRDVDGRWKPAGCGHPTYDADSDPGCPHTPAATLPTRASADEPERCAECTSPFDGSEDDERAVHADTGEPYHWACLQECYERERLADEDAT